MKILLSVILLIPFIAFSQKIDCNNNSVLESKMEELWNGSKKLYYSPKTNLFYTRPVVKVPPPEDMKALKPLKKSGVPNWHGGGSGTEDCSMLGGIILAGLCDRYKVLKDEETINRARAMFQGLKLNATAHGDRGFVARGVSPVDAKTIYPGTSRDQYTHLIHGMWRYFNSPMATKQDKKDIKQIMSDIANKMIREIRADANPPYSFKFYKGMDDDRGVGKMLEVNPHEAGRLSMFFAVAYDVTKNKTYYKHYRKHLPYAIEHSAEIVNMPKNKLRWWVPAYAVLQMTSSLEVLYVLEKDLKTKKQIEDLMTLVANFFETCDVFDLSKKRDSRDCAEVINGQLLCSRYKLSAKHESILRKHIANTKPSNSAGSYTLLSAYWRARVNGYLKP